MARLPQPGGDAGNWGNVLNDYLSQAHTSNGQLKDNSVTSAQLADDSISVSAIPDDTITRLKLAPAVRAELDSYLGQTELDARVAAVGDTSYEAIHRIDLGQLTGAVGDGVTDNTIVFQAAIDALGNTSSHVEFYLPPGVWVTDGLKLKSNMKLSGSVGGVFGLASFDTTRSSVLKLKANATRPLLADYDPTIPTYGVILEDIQLDGNKANQTVARPVIQLYDSASGMDPLWRLERVYVRNAKGDGVKIGTFRRAVKIINSEILDCDNNGIVLGATDCHVRGCLIGRSGASGIYATAGLQHISDCDIFHNIDGVRIDNVSGVMIVGCGIDLNEHNGVLTNGPRTLIVGTNFQTNGTAANNTYSHINLGFPDQTALNTVISGVAMRHDSAITNKAKYGISANAPFLLLGLGFNPADVPWVSGMTENSALAVIMARTQGIQDGASLMFGTTNGSMIGTAANQKISFHGATPTVQATGTPAAATDLATAIALANDLRTKLIAKGLIA